jgi:hypothetical protein
LEVVARSVLNTVKTVTLLKVISSMGLAGILRMTPASTVSVRIVTCPVSNWNALRLKVVKDMDQLILDLENAVLLVLTLWR